MMAQYNFMTEDFCHQAGKTCFEVIFSINTTYSLVQVLREHDSWVLNIHIEQLVNNIISITSNYVVYMRLIILLKEFVFIFDLDAISLL